MSLMHTRVLWEVVGEVWEVGDQPGKRTKRKVLVAVGSDVPAEDVMEIAQRALLHNWSQKPHKACVLGLTVTDTRVIVP